MTLGFSPISSDAISSHGLIPPIELEGVSADFSVGAFVVTASTKPLLTATPLLATLNPVLASTSTSFVIGSVTGTAGLNTIEAYVNAPVAIQTLPPLTLSIDNISVRGDSNTLLNRAEASVNIGTLIARVIYTASISSTQLNTAINDLTVTTTAFDYEPFKDDYSRSRTLYIEPFHRGYTVMVT